MYKFKRFYYDSKAIASESQYDFQGIYLVLPVPKTNIKLRWNYHNPGQYATLYKLTKSNCNVHIYSNDGIILPIHESQITFSCVLYIQLAISKCNILTFVDF